MNKLLVVVGNYFKDKDGNVVIAQRPNAPLVVWFVGFVFSSYIFKTGLANVAFSTVATIALIIWALLEVFKGVNGFRRTLGAIIFAITVVSMVRAILL